MAAEIQGGSCLVWRSPGDAATPPARQGMSKCLPGGTLGWGEGVRLSVCLPAGAGVGCAPPMSLPRPMVPHRAPRLLFTQDLAPCLNPFSKWKRASGVSWDPSWKHRAAPWARQGPPERTHPPPRGLGYLGFPSTVTSRCCRHPKALPRGRGTAWGDRRAPAGPYRARRPGGTALTASGTISGHQES